MKEKNFTIHIDNADGRVQLSIMDNFKGRGRRILRAKGSPTLRELARFDLTEVELINLRDEINNLLSLSRRGAIKKVIGKCSDHSN